jgi:probable rRNA maturation factor
MYIIEIQDDADISGIDVKPLERIATRALEIEDVSSPAELSVVFVDDAAIRALNLEYRDTDAPTDVLSFAQGDGDAFARPDGAAMHLGDVIISVDTARRQSAEYDVPLQDEVAHLLVHGVLHLLGYDHEDPSDDAQMRSREDAILGAHAHHH